MPLLFANQADLGIPISYFTKSTMPMLSRAILFLAFSTVGAVFMTESPVMQRYAFEQFKAEYGRHYDSKEENELRFAIFVKNLELIDERNSIELKSGGSGSQHGITRFADLSQDEFKNRYLKTVVPETIERKNPVSFPMSVNVSSDWTGVFYSLHTEIAFLRFLSVF